MDQIQNSDESICIEISKKSKNELIKQYNAQYYANNKQKILNQISKMVICELCGTTTTHQHLKRHQQKSLCLRRQAKKQQ